jgi:hypothetical protein
VARGVTTIGEALVNRPTSSAFYRRGRNLRLPTPAQRRDLGLKTGGIWRISAQSSRASAEIDQQSVAASAAVAVALAALVCAAGVFSSKPGLSLCLQVPLLAQPAGSIGVDITYFDFKSKGSVARWTYAF